MIEKLLALVLVLTYVTWSFTAKDTQALTPVNELVQQPTTLEVEHTINPVWTQSKIHNAIINAGEKNGWIMTKFKNNAVIAEKFIEDKSLSVTVKFDQSSFSVLPANSELEGVLATVLK